METFLPSYNKVWQDYLKTQNLTQTMDVLASLVDRPHERATKKKP